MTPQNEIEVEKAWEYQAPAPVAGIAVSIPADVTLVGAMDDTCYLIDGDGNLTNTLSVEGPVRDVGVSDDGSCFAALTEEGILHGFNPRGEERWEFDVEGAEIFDLGLSGSNVCLAVPPYAALVVDSNDPDRNTELKFQHRVSSIALLEARTTGVVAAGELGEISHVRLDGETAWKHNVGGETRKIRLSHEAEVIALPMLEEGAQPFSFDGERLEPLDFGSVVTAVAAGKSAREVLYALVIDERDFVIARSDGAIMWEYESEVLLVDFDFSPDASRLVAASGNQVVEGFNLSASYVEEDKAPQEPPPVELEEKIETGDTEMPPPPPPPVDNEVDEEPETKPQPDHLRPGAPPDSPRTRDASIVGEVPVDDADLPDTLGQINVTPDGRYCVAVLPDHGIMVFTREGDVTQEIPVTERAQIVKTPHNNIVTVWTPSSCWVLNLAEESSRRLDFGDRKAFLFQATADAELITLVDEDDNLLLMKGNGDKIGRRPVNPPPTLLAMAPAGGVIVTRDTEGRFRFFDGQGNQTRKQRIAGGGDYQHVIVEEGFCALGGTDGRIIVHEMSGKVLWTEQVSNGVARLESLGNSMAVYDEAGLCKILNPYGKVEIEFDPPPGLSLLRAPQQNDPVLLHASRNVFTAYSGYSRKLEAQWGFRADNPVRVFEASRTGDFVVIAAGSTFYCLQKDIDSD